MTPIVQGLIGALLAGTGLSLMLNATKRLRSPCEDCLPEPEPEASDTVVDQTVPDDDD